MKANGNMGARADIVVFRDSDNEKVLYKDVPAIYIVEMLNKFKEIVKLIENAPERDLTKNWQPDPEYGDHIFKTIKPTKRYKMEKRLSPVDLAPAVGPHAAQVTTQEVNVPTGLYTTWDWSSEITRGAKEKILERFRIVISALQEAKSRANEAEAPEINPSDPIIDFILEAM
ncbi:MAG: hypothetical protein GY861_21445 [bacterium]|nr:hypothetical protein [bacterium]